MVVSSDLKGMGATEGLPVSYHWTMPSLMPLLLPWLLVLGSLALKGNRCGQAWWIWAPVGLCAAAAYGTHLLGDVLPSEAADLFTRLGGGVAFGMAGAWLLAPWLRGKPRPLVFLGLFLIQAAFGAITVLSQTDLEDMVSGFGMSLAMGVLSLGMALALVLASLVTRRSFSASRLSLWTCVFLVGGWMLVSLPFVLIAIMSGGGPWWGIILGVALVAVINFAIMLPFLVLGFVNRFYRDRLMGLLGFSGESPALPLPQPAAPVGSA